MNRKQALKRLKEDKKNRNVESDTNYVNRFVMTLGLILIILVVGYILIGTFVTKTLFNDNKEEEQQEEVTIDNNTILAGQIFDQPEESYYVLVYNTKERNTFINDWKSNYSRKEGALKVYIVDVSNGLNSKYIVTENPNINPTSYDDLKITSPTLIKIENKTVTDYIQGAESIENTFKN